MFRSAFESLRTKSTFRALRHRDFAIVEFTGFFSSGGMWIYRVGIGVLTWELTESGIWLGIISMAEAMPGIFLAPIAGTLADRHDRLAMARIVQVSIMIVTGLLAAVTLAGWIEIWSLLVFTLLHGTANAFWQPVRLAIAPNFVPKEDLSAAIALHSTLFNLARFAGPAMAAPILHLWGAGATFALNTLTYLIFLVGLCLVQLHNVDRKAKAGRSMFAHVAEGFAYAKNHGAFKLIFINTIAGAVFLRAYMELLPGLSETVFGHDPKEGVAILVSAAGLGAIGGSLIIGNVTSLPMLLRSYFIAFGSAVILTAIFISSSDFWFAAGCVVFMNTALISINISCQVMIQSTVKGEIRGRGMSLWGILNRAGPSIGALLVGWLSLYAGFRLPMLVALAVTALVALYVFSRRDAMRKALVADALEDT